MGPEKQEAAAKSELHWLDEELRQAKAGLHKVEHELEQALNQIWNLDNGLRKLEESIGDARGAAAALPGIQEDIRQLRSQGDRLQDRQNDLSAQSEEMGRQQQAELGRERQERASVLSQAEAAARSVDQFESRLRLLEESQRRLEEALAALRLAQETLTHDMEELGNRGARNLETALRLEHQIDSQAAETEALHKRDGELEDRMRLYEEKIRQQEERVDEFEAHLNLPLEIKEQLDRSRFERQQISERVGKLEASANELLERTAEFVQGLARLDQRTQAQATHHLEVAEDLRRHRETVGDQLQRLVRVIERQRRRQAEALAQEIKELARSDFNPDK
jgi:chromosome segregation ATPase